MLSCIARIQNVRVSGWQAGIACINEGINARPGCSVSDDENVSK